MVYSLLVIMFFDGTWQTNAVHSTAESVAVPCLDGLHACVARVEEDLTMTIFAKSI